MGPRRSLYDEGRYSSMITLLIYHSITDSTGSIDSTTCFSRYLSDGGWDGVTSFAPCGFNELFFHSLSENHRSSVAPWPIRMKVPVVILSNVPGFSIVTSFSLKSKSRLSYAIAHRPSFNSSCIICCVSIVSDLTIFPMAVTDTLHPP